MDRVTDGTFIVTITRKIKVLYCGFKIQSRFNRSDYTRFSNRLIPLEYLYIFILITFLTFLEYHIKIVCERVEQQYNVTSMEYSITENVMIS